MTGRRDVVSTLTAVLTAAGAGVGAMLATVWFLMPSSNSPVLVLVVTAAVAAGVLVARLIAQPEVRPGGFISSHPPRPAPERLWSEPVPRSFPSVDGRARPGPDTATSDRPTGAENRQLVLPTDGADADWWARQGVARPRSAAEAVAGPAAPADLAAYRNAARVVQCPRCGAFRVDVAHTGVGFAFRCRVDEHEWVWDPGDAWPVTVVAGRRQTSRSNDTTTPISRGHAD